MTRLRYPSMLKGRLLLTLALMALGMNAFIPAGYMIAPSSSHGFAVTLCPQTNPLARAIMDSQGHEQAGDTGVDHAAMGHHSPAPDDDTPTAGRANIDCAFSALASAGDVPEHPEIAPFPLQPLLQPAALLPALAIVPDRNLRPPLRGPPTYV